MSKSIVSKYLEKSTDIYHLVDENFLRGGVEKNKGLLCL